MYILEFEVPNPVRWLCVVCMEHEQTTDERTHMQKRKDK